MKVHVDCLTLLCVSLLLLHTLPSNGQSSESGSSTRPSLQTSAIEKEALLAFKANVEDPSRVLQAWRNRTDPCADQWPGIQCSSNSTIIEINFPGFELKGELPTFEELPHLMRIILPNNSFEGPLPDAWHGLSYLQRVDLSGNKISGTLPDSWSELSHLEALNLNQNEIGGELPKEWWMLDIEVLALAKNQLEGTLPSNWGNMESIQILDLTQNKLKGNLPQSWGDLKNLRKLFLSGNSLFGSLPESWSDLSNIEDLRLENNNLVGELPQNWMFLLTANTIYLSDNNLGGFIPDGWRGISQTCRIDLSNNPYICNSRPSGSVIAEGERGPGFVLTGTKQGNCPSKSAQETQALLQFKSELALTTEDDPLESWKWKGESACEDQWVGIHCQNGRVVELDLSGFGLSGALSEKLSQLSNLEDLNLQNNQFGDGLPASWHQFEALKHLNLSKNAIEGQLPSAWSALSQLEALDVSQNNLLGALPPQWSALTNLRTFKGGQNNIDGPLPFSWSSMESLEILHVQENIITGALPMTWGALSELTELDLSQNQLLGPVPPQWRALEKLKVFNLDENEQLCGGIPDSLPQPSASIQRNLSRSCPAHIEEAILLIEFKSEVQDPQQYLSLWKADSQPCQSEQGRWPGVQCRKQRVIGLDLDGFQLQGRLSVSSIVKIQNLENLNFSRNEFEGSLPPVWGQLDNLKILNLSSNALTGNLPPEWGQMESLEVLDLSNNDLEGSMPTEWSGMVRLQSMDVSGLTKLCDGLPNHLDSNRVHLRSENSTFQESCDSDGDSSSDFSVISILLSVFIVITVVVWVSCFCCCCWKRKKQHQKLLEMVSSGVLRSRQRSEKDSSVSPMRIQANAPLSFEDRPGTSTQTASNGQPRDSHYNRSRSGYLETYNTSRTAPPTSSYQRMNESVFFPPVMYPLHPLPHRFYDHWSYHGPRLHPEYSRMTHFNQTPNQGLRVQNQNQSPPGTSRRRIGFGSIQSLGPSTSRGERQGRQSEEQSPTSQHRRAFEVFREPQRHSPTSVQEGRVLATPLRADSENHVIDPRRVRSKIPRLVHTSTVPTSTNEASSSAYQSFVDNTLHSTERQEDQDGSTQLSSSPLSDRNLDRSLEEEVAPDAGPSQLHSQIANDSWNLETTLEIPNEAGKEMSSLSAEMFRWLESCQQSGTFDLEDLSRELFTRQQQGPPSTNTHLNFTPAAQRFSALNVANIAADGIQSSTKDLLFWLESKIDEVKRAPVDQLGRNKNIRSSRFPGDSNLFNYKTSSTMTDG